MNETFIYALRDPRNGKVFYIGESVNPIKRWIDHQYQRKFCATYNRKLASLLQELWIQGFRPMLQIIEKCQDNWRERERFWISDHRRRGFHLLNVDCGGRARSGGQVGHPCPDWWKEELRRRNTGSKKPEETKRKIRDTNIKTWTTEKRLEHSRLMSSKGFTLLSVAERKKIARMGGLASKGKPKRRKRIAVL